MPRSPILAALATLACALLLAACGSSGGGSGGTNGAPPPPPPPAGTTGTMNVSITDGPTTAYDHVWVTLTEVRFHASNAAAIDDAGWIAFPLDAPLTVDLAALGYGDLAPFLSNLQLPVGTYRQVRVFLLDAAAPLADSALAQGLVYNAQVDWTDGQGSHASPLETVLPAQGVAITGSFTVAAAAPLNVAIDFDIGHDVVAMGQGAARAFLLKPLLHAYDLAHSGAVFGRIDPTDLCTSGPAPTCAYDLVIKAEVLHPSGAYHYATRTTTVRSDGTFMLYPVAVPAGQLSTTVDVLVRGRNMETILVRNVPVQSGTAPRVGPTILTATNLPVTIGNEYTANAAAAVAPTGAWIDFAQTLSATGQTEVPYEVRHWHLDPFTGVLPADIPLSRGPLHVGNYVLLGTPTLSAVAPVEGAGGFVVFADAPGYTRTESGSDPLQAPVGTAPAPFAVPAVPVNAALFAAASISGQVQQATPGQYDRGQLVVTWMGTIVTTLPLDGVLAANGGTGGAYTVANVPGGTLIQPTLLTRYGLYARVWNSANPAGTFKRIDVTGDADLRAGSASGVNVVLN